MDRLKIAETILRGMKYDHGFAIGILFNPLKWYIIPAKEIGKGHHGHELLGTLETKYVCFYFLFISLSFSFTNPAFQDNIAEDSILKEEDVPLEEYIPKYAQQIIDELNEIKQQLKKNTTQ